MNRIIIVAICIMLCVPARYVSAHTMKSIKLMSPQLDKGRPLMQVLKDRKSSREFALKPLPLQVLSNLLWAAYGINRPETGDRTAPSGMNYQDIDIYVATADGVYLYNAKDNLLLQIIKGDIREQTGGDPYVKNAPINLIFISNYSKTKQIPPGLERVFCCCTFGFYQSECILVLCV